jgi:hypothetical protein
MTKKVLIFIIVFIIFYEIYLLYLESPIETTVKNKQIIKSPKLQKSEQKISPIENKLFSYINENINENINEELNNKELNNEELNNELIENINPMLFGKPSQYEKDNIIIWTFIEPKPWTKVIYKYNEKYPFNFYIKIKIPSLNDYSNWKKIINNLNFDPRSGEIIIPCEDEETALSISNLIISNFKGDLTLEEIISKNLIDVSINKAKKYEVVKNKLIDQIMTNLSNKPVMNESINDTETFITDLAKQQKNEEYSAYEGTEYSFF